jgi:uncharacterized protein (TIGR02246 family)
MLRLGVLCVALLLPVVLVGDTSRKSDEAAIRAVMNSFMDAWNRHDAKAWAALFSEDADFTNVRGMGASGRSNIEEFHASRFATIFKNSNQKYTDIKTRFIRPDIAAVDVHWEMTGAAFTDGNPSPTRRGLLNFTMVKSKGNWQIVVMHNLDLSASPPLAK